MANREQRRANQKLSNIVQAGLNGFYKSRLECLRKLDLKKLLKQKNPYLFRAIGIDQPDELLRALLAAYLSSSDEGIFGNAFFEPVAQKVSGTPKSITDSVDFEKRVKGVTRAYAVKSGPRAFNSQSRSRQMIAFDECQRRLQGKPFEAVVGYGYGQQVSAPTAKKRFREVSGQVFWEEISGDPRLYKKILNRLGNKADEHIGNYRKAHSTAVSRLVKEFKREFAMADGRIDWDKLLVFNSGKKV